jgi:hypothetical protein
MDHVRLWAIGSGEQLHGPEQGYVLRGPPSCMVWVRRKDDARNVLVFGTARGYLVFWREGQAVNHDCSRLLDYTHSHPESSRRIVFATDCRREGNYVPILGSSERGHPSIGQWNARPIYTAMELQWKRASFDVFNPACINDTQGHQFRR